MRPFICFLCLFLTLGLSSAAVPVIYCTDLFHPHEDPDDHFDLATVLALPELDVRAILLDQGSRQKRQSGSLPVRQMLHLSGRSIPYAIGLSEKLTAFGDDGRSQPAEFQAAIELMLNVLRESSTPVTIIAAGSVRDICAAWNREPVLLKQKVHRLYLNIGNADPNGSEYNVDLDAKAYVGLLRSGLPIYLCYCLPMNGQGPYAPLSTWWRFRQSEVLESAPQGMQNFFLYALHRTGPDELDPMRALTMDLRPWHRLVWQMDRNMWCTSSLLHAAGRNIYAATNGWSLTSSSSQGGTPATLFRFSPARIDVDDSGKTITRLDSTNANMHLFQITQPAQYPEAMRHCLRELIHGATTQKEIEDMGSLTVHPTSESDSGLLRPYLENPLPWLYLDSIYWTLIGLAGTLIFSSRFIIQWLYSERQKKLVIPPVFWHLSFWGSLVSLIYALHLDKLPIILSFLFLPVLYGRNLLLLRRTAAACLLLLSSGGLGMTAENVEMGRPNILWITAEDISPDLGCYGDLDARTPHLDAFSNQGIRYTKAFATAPVCSPARSCLITGVYATSLGTQRLRSQFPVPKPMRGFAALLREKGYYCSNNVKTDYNLQHEREFIRDCWNDCSVKAHWRGRKPGQPFFAVFNLMTTHQSRASVWSYEEFEKEVGSKLAPQERHDPNKVRLPPYYPDTLEARRTWARYHDCITLMDQQVGKILKELHEDGLAEETVVFFFGDNGMGLPRGKRCLFDTGLHEPLIIRFPKAWSGLAPEAPGQTTDRLVSFVDFAPTVLSLCGVSIPGHMQGAAFLGTAVGQPRQYVYGARDRVDEAFDLSRSVRDQRFLYVRNFMPHLSWMQPENYSDASSFRREIKTLARTGRLNAAQLTYAGSVKSTEELYDTESDPHQIHNLASSPEHQSTLERMRGVLRRNLLSTRDAGFLTEPQVWERITPAQITAWELAQNDSSYPLDRLIDTAELVGHPESALKQIQFLKDSDDGVRYWAALGLHASGTLSATARQALIEALKDPSPVVRIEAAAALVKQGDAQRGLEALISGLKSDPPEVVLHAARALELLGDAGSPAVPTMRDTLLRMRQKEEQGGDIYMFIRFSLESALR